MRFFLLCLALLCSLLASQDVQAGFPGKRIAEALDIYQGAFFRQTASDEALLGWYGAPPLTDGVYRVETRQYRVVSPFVEDPVTLSLRQVMHFTPDGTLAQVWRDHRGDGEYVSRSIFDEGVASPTVAEGVAETRYRVERDELGRLERVERIGPDGRGRIQARYIYTGNAVAMVDATGMRTTVLYDGAGNPVAEEVAPDNRPDRPVSRAEAVWDEAGKPSLIREVSISSPETVTRFTYDQDGRLIERETRQPLERNRILSRITAFYDERGRCVQRTLSVQGQSTANTYHYDEQGRVSSVERLIADTSGSRREELVFAYDERGNWVRCVVLSPTRPSVVERDIVYYPDQGAVSQ